MDDFTIEISIPTDDDGFVLLQCPKCGEYFKLLPADIQSDEVPDIHCPQCGLVSGNYLTEDVTELARTKAINHFMEEFYEKIKKMEKKTHNSLVEIEVNKPTKKEEKIPIQSTIDPMETVDFACCKRQGKIRHLLNSRGCYCPYCGNTLYKI